jgi:hypothetical protein
MKNQRAPKQNRVQHSIYSFSKAFLHITLAGEQLLSKKYLYGLQASASNLPAAFRFYTEFFPLPGERSLNRFILLHTLRQPI